MQSKFSRWSVEFEHCSRIADVIAIRDTTNRIIDADLDHEPMDSSPPIKDAPPRRSKRNITEGAVVQCVHFSGSVLYSAAQLLK